MPSMVESSSSADPVASANFCQSVRLICRVSVDLPTGNTLRLPSPLMSPSSMKLSTYWAFSSSVR